MLYKQKHVDLPESNVILQNYTWLGQIKHAKNHNRKKEAEKTKYASSYYKYDRIGIDQEISWSYRNWLLLLN